MVANRISLALQSRLPRNITGNYHTPAAVLMPIQERDDGDYLVLTKRAEHLNRHSGQIAFPGGRIDAGDSGALAAALRESQEEIGLDPAAGQSARPDRPGDGRLRLRRHALRRFDTAGL